MINFELNNSEYFELKELSVLKVDDLDASLMEIQTLINYFNKEYQWDKMFNFDDVKNRIFTGHFMFILYYDNTAIGYVFYEPKENNQFYLYNLYVTNQIKRPVYSATWFVNHTIKLLPKTFSKIICVCDSWHDTAHNIFKNNGFKQLTD